MTFLEAVKTCFGKYATFSGRARRSEYWYWCLFSVLCAFVLNGRGLFRDENTFLYSVFSLATFIPSLAVCVRRFHDIGKSGWAMLIALIPVAGIFIAIAWLCRDSEEGANLYGQNPKNPEVAYSYTPTPEPEKPREEYHSPFAAGPKTESPAFCTYCGSKLKAGQKFCENCGAKVE